MRQEGPMTRARFRRQDKQPKKLARIEEEDDFEDDGIGVGDLSDLPNTYMDVDNLLRRNEAFVQIPVPGDDSDSSQRNDLGSDMSETTERNISDFEPDEAESLRHEPADGSSSSSSSSSEFLTDSDTEASTEEEDQITFSDGRT